MRGAVGRARLIMSGDDGINSFADTIMPVGVTIILCRPGHVSINFKDESIIYSADT
ncbi:hypothetical protein [Jeotgalibacillus malaysiensis]|uniref:hypothetical protein n=1 Tax=Jeotgalibacillus malaysiensis TaxID=1508404 RepID=UPI0038503322